MGLFASPFTLLQPADPPAMHSPKRKGLEESNLFQSFTYPQCVQKSRFGCKIEEGKGKGGKLPAMEIWNLSKDPGAFGAVSLGLEGKDPMAGTR